MRYLVSTKEWKAIELTGYKKAQEDFRVALKQILNKESDVVISGPITAEIAAIFVEHGFQAARIFPKLEGKK